MTTTFRRIPLNDQRRHTTRSTVLMNRNRSVVFFASAPSQNILRKPLSYQSVAAGPAISTELSAKRQISIINSCRVSRHCFHPSVYPPGGRIVSVISICLEIPLITFLELVLSLWPLETNGTILSGVLQGVRQELVSCLCLHELHMMISGCLFEQNRYLSHYRRKTKRNF